MPNPTSIAVLDAASTSQTISTMDALLAVFGALADAAAANGASATAMGYLRAIKDAQTSTTPSAVSIDQTGTNNNVVATPASAAYALLPAPSTYRLLSAAASTNAALIKAGAGAVKGLQGYNVKTSAVYLKIYNKASAAPTVGTDTPVKTLYIPASAAFAFDFGTGVSFGTGIGIAITGAAADSDTTALVAGDVVCLNVDFH